MDADSSAKFSEKGSDSSKNNELSRVSVGSSTDGLRAVSRSPSTDNNDMPKRKIERTHSHNQTHSNISSTNSQKRRSIPESKTKKRKELENAGCSSSDDDTRLVSDI